MKVLISSNPKRAFNPAGWEVVRGPEAQPLDKRAWERMLLKAVREAEPNVVWLDHPFIYSTNTQTGVTGGVPWIVCQFDLAMIQDAGIAVVLNFRNQHSSLAPFKDIIGTSDVVIASDKMSTSEIEMISRYSRALVTTQKDLGAILNMAAAKRNASKVAPCCSNLDRLR
jgi:hypothetical protein